MEGVLNGVAQIFTCLLPVAGVIALIYLALLFKKLIESLKEIDRTLIIVEDQVRKLDDPLNTVQDLSHTVDDVHHSTREAVIHASASIKENMEKAKSTLNNKDFKEDIDDAKTWVKDKTNEVVTIVKDTIDNN